MTSKQELLEMSAKAMGYEFYYRGLYNTLPAVLTIDGDMKYWMPLEKSEQAFELSVALEMKVEQFPENVSANYPAHVIAKCSLGPRNGYQAIQEHGADALEATRLAIVMVAAEVGRRMK